MCLSVTRLMASLGGVAILVIAAGGCDGSSSSYDDTSITVPDTGSAQDVDSGDELDTDIDDVSSTDASDVLHEPDSDVDVADVDVDATTDADVDATTDADVLTDADASTDTDADTEPPPPPGGFGDYCDDERPCDGDHFCHIDFGVCTRECDPPGSLCPGLPAPNTYSKCLHELDDGYACAFICVLDHDDHVHTYDCPPELSCEGAGGPGAGHQLCES